MYSYQDRMTAVELYIKLGRRITATIRQLGYPTKNALRSWYREYQRHNDLTAGYVRSKPKYSVEQRRLTVEHYLSRGRCFAETQRALGYPGRGTIAGWVEEFHPETRERIVGNAGAAAHPQGLKQNAVIELCSRQGSAHLIAQNAGVSRPTLYNWKNQLLGREAPASMRRRNDPLKSSEHAEPEQQIASLRRDMRQLQLGHGVLKKANEVFRKGPDVEPVHLSNSQKTVVVDSLRQAYKLPELLAQLRLARSSYFYHRARQRRADKYDEVRRTMAEIFETNHRCYGYRRMRAQLARQQVFLSESVVRRLMKQEGLTLATAKRRRYVSYSGEIGPAPENLVKRDFRAAAPNEKWLTDITELHIAAGKVYLSPVIDCFDGLVVSWSIGTRPDAELVNTMLDAAIGAMNDGSARPIIHSDRGAHYRWPGWLSRVRDAKLIRSMSRKGCSPDNAACEGFVGRLKTELFYPRDWRTTTIERFIEILDSYLRWYNEKRIKISLGSLSPVEYRRSLGLSA